LDQHRGKLWILKAFGVFLLGLVFWFVLAIWTGTSFALDLQIAQDIRSKLLADYGEGPVTSDMKYLNLAILGDIFSDQGLPDESIGLVEDLLDNPVPTATIAGDQGETAQPPASTATQTPDIALTAIAEETENNINIFTITETPTPSPTNTLTETPTSTLTPTSTKINFPTKTPSPTPKPTNTQVIDDVYPILECVVYQGGGIWEAYFGYRNPSTETQYILVGDRNYFKPEPKDRGQPTKFLPGRSASYPDFVFSVEFEENAVLTWHLTGYSVEASKYSDYCDVIYIPSPTPTTTKDTITPILSGGSLYPEPGFIVDCCAYIFVENLHVEDPPYSSGIMWVKLKYIVEDYTSDLYSDPMKLVDGGWTEGDGWSGDYNGSVEVNIDPEWQSPATGPFTIKVWGKARDNASHDGLSFLGTYTMPERCGSASE
jgi:hypothetical protein